MTFGHGGNNPAQESVRFLSDRKASVENFIQKSRVYQEAASLDAVAGQGTGAW